MNEIPERNMENPNHKGVDTVKFDLFDVSDPENMKRMSLDAAYDPNSPEMHMPPDGLKLSITVGDNAASTNMTLPMWFLWGAITQLMAEHQKAKQSSLVGFDKPNIIVPN